MMNSTYTFAITMEVHAVKHKQMTQIVTFVSAIQMEKGIFLNLHLTIKFRNMKMTTLCLFSKEVIFSGTKVTTSPLNSARLCKKKSINKGRGRLTLTPICLRCEIFGFCLLSFCQNERIQLSQFLDFLRKVCLFFNF